VARRSSFIGGCSGPVDNLFIIGLFRSQWQLVVYGSAAGKQLRMLTAMRYTIYLTPESQKRAATVSGIMLRSDFLRARNYRHGADNYTLLLMSDWLDDVHNVGIE
jgi:hypothetical protein